MLQFLLGGLLVVPRSGVVRPARAFGRVARRARAKPIWATTKLNSRLTEE